MYALARSTQVLAARRRRPSRLPDPRPGRSGSSASESDAAVATPLKLLPGDQGVQWVSLGQILAGCR
jgi:hypothetical protein